MLKLIFAYFTQVLVIPFRLIMRVKIAPSDPLAESGINKAKPILYVLPTQSKTDLFVLRWQCKLHGLPIPSLSTNAVRSGKNGYLYLSKLGLFLRRRAKSAPAPLYDLLKLAKENSEFEVQVVPVTIIWGRNPGKHEATFWKLVFSDDENAGFLRKFFIMIFQGHNIFMHIGRPISLQEQAKSEANIDQTAKKIRRVIRVHFYKQRVATVGPTLYDRSFVGNMMLQAKPIQQYIEQEEQKKPGQKKKLEETVRRYVMELAAEPKPAVIRGYEILLRYIWQKIFNGVEIFNSEELRDLHATHEVVYLTCHRSHIDYLLLGYVLYELGVTSPHTAAGNNLNFWPAGRFLRAGGAFFIRRSFKGNRLYSLVFNEYLHFLLTKGYTVNFFPEGGRSRTGRTLPAKTGMLSMVVHSCLRDNEKPVALVPVYVGYDQVVEIGSYLKELSGKTKKKESFKQLFGIFKIFRNKYGKAYVNFGPPMELSSFLQTDLGLWDGRRIGANEKPEWFSQGVSKIASEIMARINGSAVLSPVALSAMAILATPQKAIAESDFRRFFAMSFGLLEVIKKYYPGVYTSSEDLQIIVNKALQDKSIRRFKYPGDDVLYLSELDAIKMTYYKNNIVHVFVGIAMIANQFINNDRLAKESVLLSCMHIYPFVDREYYIGLNPDVFRAMINDLINAFVRLGLLQLNQNELIRPNVTTETFATLRHLGNAIGSVFERYGIAVALIQQHKDQPIDLSGFEEQCAQLSDRIALLNGQMDPNSFDTVKLKGFVDTVKKLGYVAAQNDGRVLATEKMSDLFASLSLFLSQDIISSVQRSKIDQDHANAEN